MEEIEVTITNWDKYQPPSEKVRHPHWFKMKNDLPASFSLTGFSVAEKWAWVSLLCMASKKKSGTFKINIKQAAIWMGVNSQDIENMIKKMVTDSSLTVNCQSTDHRSDQNRSDQIRIDQIRSDQNRVDAELSVEPDATHSVSPPTEILFSVSDDGRKKLAKLYPDEEFVNREVIKMGIWLEANGHKKPKSKSGWTRFVMGWLERGWERHRTTLQTNKASGIDAWKKMMEEKRRHMERNYFQIQIARMEKVFGPISPDRINLFWNAVKSMSESWMESVTNNFIGNFRSQPLLKDFIEKIDEYTSNKALPAGLPQEFKQTDCKLCGGDGYAYSRDKNGYSFINRCSCIAGSQRPKTALGPKRMDESREEIFIPQIGSEL